LRKEHETQASARLSKYLTFQRYGMLHKQARRNLNSTFRKPTVADLEMRRTLSGANRRRKESVWASSLLSKAVNNTVAPGKSAVWFFPCIPAGGVAPMKPACFKLKGINEPLVLFDSSGPA
jgi:hypothetical protein